VTHLNHSGKLSRYFPALLRWELRHSAAELRRRLGRWPSSISMAWNEPAERLEPEVRRIYSACRLGSGTLRANDLARLNWYGLHSWAPDSKTSAAEIVDLCRATPPAHWLILQFHSLDGEGYMPIATKDFREVLRGLQAKLDMRHVSVDEMITAFRNFSPPKDRERSRSR